MLKKSLLIIIVLCLGFAFSSTYRLHAQNQTDDGTEQPAEDITVNYYGEGEAGETDKVSLNMFELGSWGNIEGIGILALLALIAQFLFAFLIVIWIFIAIFAGLKIIRSQGNPEGIQGGMTRIKNLWAGVTIGLLFFVAVSFIGMFAGVGNIFEWADNLQECSCEKAVSGQDCYTYLFQAKASVENEEDYKWFCPTNIKLYENSYGRGWRATTK